MRVVVCEQQQQPSEINRTSSGLLHRHVTRVVTRGTVVEESLLAPRAHNFLAAIAFDPRGGSALVGIAWVDISTGYVATKLSSRAALQGDLLLHPPAELVVPVANAEGDVQVDTAELPPPGRTPPSLAFKAALEAGGGGDSLLGRLSRISTAGAASRAAIVEQRWDDADAARLGSQTRDLRLDDATDDCAVAFLCADAFSTLSPALTDVLTRGAPQSPSSDVERMALGGLLTYAQWTQRGAGLQLQHPVSLSMPALPCGHTDASAAPSSEELTAKAGTDVPSTPLPFMVIDPATRRALELTRPPNGRRRARGSLLHTLDLCRTAMGSRLLDRRLAMPLVDAALIEQRLDAVGALASAPFFCESIRVRLARIADLDRCRQRICVGRHSYKDLFALRDGLADAWKLGALLLTGDDLAAESLSLPESTTPSLEASHSLYARALGACALPSAPREDAIKLVLDAARVDYDVQWPRMPEKREEGATVESQTLATCAAVLLSPLRALPSGGPDLPGSGASASLLGSLASAYTSLVDGLVAAPTPAVANAAGSSVQFASSMGGGVDDTSPLDGTALPAAGDDPEGSLAAPVAGGRKTASPGDAWYIRPGFSAELDAARALLTSASGLERDLQARLQSITGVRTLRVRRGLDERLFVEAPARAVTQLQPFLQTPAAGGAPLLHIERSLKSSTRFRCAEVQVR